MELPRRSEADWREGQDLYSEVTQNFPVPMRPGETPVPIPNTTVKAWAADGTTLETAWESRRAPDQKKR